MTPQPCSFRHSLAGHGTPWILEDDGVAGTEGTLGSALTQVEMMCEKRAPLASLAIRLIVLDGNRGEGLEDI